MRSIISILLVAIFMFQSVSKLLLIANYEINKDYISKNLCENRKKAGSHCNGKCHLAKQLKNQEKKENSPLNNIKEKTEITYSPQHAESFGQFGNLIISLIHTPYLLKLYTEPVYKILLPPC